MITIKGYYQSSCKRPINAVLGVSRTNQEDFISLDDVKAHMKVDFADEDPYIRSLVKAARFAIENYTGLSLCPCDVVVLLRNDISGIDLPYGPVSTISSIKNADGDTMTTDEYKNEGTDFPSIIQSVSRRLTVSYSAGYTEQTLPEDLKFAIMHQVAYLYENRGDGKLSETAKQLADPYKQITWLI